MAVNHVSVNGVVVDAVRLRRQSPSFISFQFARCLGFSASPRHHLPVAVYEHGRNCGVAFVNFLVVDNLSEDIWLGSNWRAYIGELIPHSHPTDDVEQDVTLCGGVFLHEPVSTFDPGSGVGPMISDSSSHPPVTPCPVPDIWRDHSPTRNAPYSPPVESSVLFVDDVENECYATTFAAELHIPYTERPHMEYLRDLLFGLSENVLHLFVNSSSSIHSTLASHGIGHEGLSMDECCLLYASHMVTGDFFPGMCHPVPTLYNTAIDGH
ncbi:hypothetical protein EV421DRAFT_1737369 [Armillaria borealis]|uniref:Uncharacterized protein n=1 Tax=Armillaria borealis TaxID=47425 RepID=A0AA39MNV2_9AGAR|nr:hypothetical protein EV421DRAFT_1737369 [Armillaria borealis]